MTNIKVASWNIAGGYPINSLDQFDYSEENINYFSNELKKLNPDIICLQESHTSIDGKRVIAEEIAKNLEMNYVFNISCSPSHINDQYQLSLSIISNKELKDQKIFWFPDPSVELFFSDGKKAITHKKALQIIRVDDFYIANNQMLPVTLFGYSYDDKSEGHKLAEGINEVMKNIKQPVVWCGDFNFSDPKKIYKTINDLNLNEALPDKPTRPLKSGEKKTPDHIFYSSDFKLITSDVVTTNSDHYLCFSEFEISNS